MLQVSHKGTYQASLPLNTSGFTTDPVANAKLAYVAALVSGIAVGLDTNGLIQIHDGTADLTNTTFMGFLLLNASGEEYGNRSAMAASNYQAAVIMKGGAQINTDQIGVASIDAGDLLYIDDSGLVTNVQATSESVIGIAVGGATTASPALEMLLY